MNKIIECVPNFSEGKDKKIIDAIAEAISSVNNVTLLDVDPGKDTNRTVYTFIGDPESIVEAAFQAIKKGQELIDMTKHKGAHARIGAADVVPFIPVANATMEECVELANILGKRVGEELGIPVYLYEYAAKNEKRRNLADIRQGEYEGLKEKLKDPEWAPDYGKAEFNPKSGATVIGAREFLIAYNVNLNTKDEKLANQIALNIREKGKLKRDENGAIVKDENGEKVYEPGLLKAVKAVGWYIDQYKQAQISINLINYKVTPLHKVFETCCQEAEKLGLRVTGSELVGLIPKEAMLEAGKYFLIKQGKSYGVSEEELIHTAVLTMGLDQLSEFDPKKKIIDYRIQENETLISMNVKEFVNEVASDSPAPGGGSIAALAGSLASSLGAMVASLTTKKKEYNQYFEQMCKIAENMHSAKMALLKLIDKDTDAFNEVMAAMKLPKKTDEEKIIREKAINEANIKAALIPYETFKISSKIIDDLIFVVKNGNKNSITDAGVALSLLKTALQGAEMNVLINMSSINDENLKKKIVEEINAIKNDVFIKIDENINYVYENIR